MVRRNKDNGNKAENNCPGTKTRCMGILVIEADTLKVRLYNGYVADIFGIDSGNINYEFGKALNCEDSPIRLYELGGKPFTADTCPIIESIRSGKEIRRNVIIKNNQGDFDYYISIIPCKDSLGKVSDVTVNLIKSNPDSNY